MNMAIDYDSFTNFTANENDDKKIIIKYLLSSISSSLLLLSLIGPMIWSLMKPLKKG